MPNEPLSTQNYVQIGDKVLNRTADASVTTNDVSLSDRVFVFKKNEDGSIKTVVNTTIQYIVDAFSQDATAIKVSCNQIKADTSQLKADTEALKNAAVTAKTSAESARDSAISAKNSASTSATNASNSEAMAKKWASNPVGSIVADSKYSAYHYAVNASTSAKTATTKASEASASASSASTSANNASSSASSASASATSASNSASTATTKASEASTSANQAKGYRDEAKGYRDEINPSLLAPKVHTHTASDITNLLDTIYPVGSIYLTISTNPLNPSGSSPASWLGGKWYLLPADKALWTASSGAGQTIDAGLPNIKGGFSIYSTYVGDILSWDAFEKESSGNSDWAGANKNNRQYSKLSFDASRLSSVYRNDVNTVQPPAYKVYAWRREA